MTRKIHSVTQMLSFKTNLSWFVVIAMHSKEKIKLV